MALAMIRNGALAIAAALVAAGCSSSVDELTLFSAQDGGQAVVAVPQDGVVPYRVGTSCYGWLLEFEQVAGTVEVEEVLSLPAPAEQWGSADRSDVASDGRSARTVVRVDGQGGTAQHSWCVAEGDPEGIYTFAISRNGQEVGKLRFRLQRS